MPKVMFTNPGVKDSVSRPVTLDIARQVLVWTGLPENTPILYNGETETAKQPGSGINTDPEINKFGSDMRLDIVVSETYQTDRILSTAVYYEDSNHTFVDPDTFVYMRPSYSPTDIEFRFRIRHSDKDAAIRWRNDIRMRVSMMRDERVHVMSYSYLIPLEVMTILKEIHRLRELNAPYGETFDEYFERYVSPKATILSDLKGGNQVRAIAETQAKVLGWFDFEGYPEEGTKDPSNSSWTIEFGYKIKFDNPLATVLEYPLMIHNQLIDKKYRPTAKPYRIEDYALEQSLSGTAFEHFVKALPPALQRTQGLPIPIFDEFIPPQGGLPSETTRIVTALVSIDPTDPKLLINLSDLGKVQLHPCIQELLKTEIPWLMKHTQSVFNLTVFKNDVPMPRDSFEVLPDLTVKLIEDADPRSTYHVRLSYFERPRLLPVDAKDRMRKNACATNLLFEAMKPSLVPDGQMAAVMPGNYIARSEFDRVADIIDLGYDSRNNGQVYQFNTVMVLFIDSSVNY